MAATQFVLIPGRSSRQGVTLNEGKYTDGYLDETSTLRMNPNDMQRMGVSTGDEVRMWNDIGEVVVPCLDAKDECPEGLVFICYGDKSSQLMGGETHGSGMPDSKGLDVFIHPAGKPKPTVTHAEVQETKPKTPATKATTASASQPPDKTQHLCEQSPAVAQATSSQSKPQPQVRKPASGLGPTLVMGLFVLVLIVLAVVMKLSQ